MFTCSCVFLRPRKLKTFKTSALQQHYSVKWLIGGPRRLVTVLNPSTTKQDFDVLPIASAIARIVKLLNLGKPETCRFRDVFLPNEKEAIEEKQSTKSTRLLTTSFKKRERVRWSLLVENELKKRSAPKNDKKPSRRTEDWEIFID